MTKIIVYDDDEQEFVANGEQDYTRRIHHAKTFSNVEAAENWVRKNFPAGSFSYLELIE